MSYSYDDEFSTFNTNINCTHHIQAACKDLAPNCRFYYAGTSEVWLMLQQQTPEDYVIGTGVLRSMGNVGWLSSRSALITRLNFCRAEVLSERNWHVVAIADFAKARLGWVPKVGFEEL